MNIPIPSRKNARLKLTTLQTAEFYKDHNPMLSHRERLQACLSNDSALDRPPVALWRHFPIDDQNPDSLAAATLAYQNQFDFDLVKVTPASSFCLRDWGVEDKWEGDPEGTRRYSKRVVTKPEDWTTLPVLTLDAPHLAAQLECLRLLRSKLGPETPLLQTIFNPMSQAKNLAGGDNLILHLRQYPDAVKKGLETIAESTHLFIEAAIETGIDGIFYAIQHAQSHLLTAEEYMEFSKPHDSSLLTKVNDLWCNMIHLHGENIFFEQAASLSAQILNWHDRETDWSLASGLEKFKGAVCGGLKRETVVLGNRDEIIGECEDSFLQTQRRRFILGTGCVVPITAPYGNIMAVRKSVKVKK
jgi:uroporphyrinogen decarboxylase